MQISRDYDALLSISPSWREKALHRRALCCCSSKYHTRQAYLVLGVISFKNKGVQPSLDRDSTTSVGRCTSRPAVGHASRQEDYLDHPQAGDRRAVSAALAFKVATPVFLRQLTYSALRLQGHHGSRCITPPRARERLGKLFQMHCQQRENPGGHRPRPPHLPVIVLKDTTTGVRPDPR